MPAAIFRMRTVVQIVVTPGSGEGRARCTTRRLRRALKRRGYEVRVQSFGSLGKLLEWSDSCEPDFSHLVAVGGDATLSAAAGASVRLSIPFVPVPSGFGNMFARAFGFDSRTPRVTELFERGQVRRVCVMSSRRTRSQRRKREGAEMANTSNTPSTGEAVGVRLR